MCSGIGASNANDCQYEDPSEPSTDLHGYEDLLDELFFVHAAVDVNLHHVLCRCSAIRKSAADKLCCESGISVSLNYYWLLTTHPINRPKPTWSSS